MLTFLIVIIVFSILIIVHEIGHMLVAKRLGVKVETFSLGFGKKIWGIKRGGTEYALSLFPFGGYVKLSGDNPEEAKGEEGEFYSKSSFVRFLIIVGGPVTNLLFAFILFVAIFTVGVPSLTTGVGKLLPDYPAYKSGIIEGDRIVAIDSKNVQYWNELVEIVQMAKDGATLDFEVKRGDELLHFMIAPKVVTTKNIFGQETTVGMIGISPKSSMVLVRHTPFRAIVLAAERLVTLMALTYKSLWLLITGGMPFKESVSGPIGIAFMIGEAARLGFVYLLNIMAHINIALAVFNLLPFPVLDGGHVLFLVIEKLRGKPVNARTQEIVSQVALYILVALALFISWNDIVRNVPFMKR